MVSTQLKNISQIGNLPLVGVKIKNIWNHRLVVFRVPFFFSEAKARFIGIPSKKIENPGGDYCRGKGVTTQVLRYDSINVEWIDIPNPYNQTELVYLPTCAMKINHSMLQDIPYIWPNGIIIHQPIFPWNSRRFPLLNIPPFGGSKTRMRSRANLTGWVWIDKNRSFRNQNGIKCQFLKQK